MAFWRAVLLSLAAALPTRGELRGCDYGIACGTVAANGFDLASLGGRLVTRLGLEQLAKSHVVFGHHAEHGDGDGLVM